MHLTLIAESGYFCENCAIAARILSVVYIAFKMYGRKMHVFFMIIEIEILS